MAGFLIILGLFLTSFASSYAVLDAHYCYKINKEFQKFTTEAFPVDEEDDSYVSDK